jgi:signal transduction histidine kinase
MIFADILASIIHDMKNSLGMVINTLEGLSCDGQPNDQWQNSRVKLLQQEAKRLNNNLIELLTLYKLKNERITPNIEELNLSEFLEEIAAENRALAEAQGVRFDWQCAADLNGYFDEGLVRGVINNLIGNGLRYTRHELLLVAEAEEGYLVLRVEDDGEGFPPEMLAVQHAIDGVDGFSDGRTHLGIYFAGMVARLHRDRGREGFIRLSNDCHLPGGCFSLLLP